MGGRGRAHGGVEKDFELPEDGDDLAIEAASEGLQSTLDCNVQRLQAVALLKILFPVSAWSAVFKFLGVGVEAWPYILICIRHLPTLI